MLGKLARHVSLFNKPNTVSFYLSHVDLDIITFQDPFFKIFANQPPVFIISFHLPEIPPLPVGYKTHHFFART